MSSCSAAAAGTPISNNLSELWSLLNFLMPTLVGSSDDFHAWFSSSAAGGCEAAAVADDPDATAEAALLSEEEELIVTSRLHQVLRPFMLRRMKESVASELPSKQERLLLCPPSAYQRSLFGIIVSPVAPNFQAAELRQQIQVSHRDFQCYFI
jgi:SNF2 family DNA or RNA helicase